MLRTVTYLFGRLNIISLEHDKQSIYSTALSTSAPLVRRQTHTWGFSDVEMVHHDVLGDMYEGFLVKYKDQESVEVVNTEARVIEDEDVQNLIAAHSRFFLHVQSGIIAYHPIGTVISGNAFVARFAEIIENAYERFFISAEILPVNEPEAFKEALRHFTRIDRLSIYLHPSNPSSRDIWQSIDDKLRAMNARDYREEYNGQRSDRGLRPDADEMIERKIAIVEDGYGHAEATGIRGGKKRIASTRSLPLSVDAPSDSAESPDVLKALSDTFRSVLRRFEK